MSTPVSQHDRVPRKEARRRIVEATARLLGERRFRDLSVDIVMREAGLSRTVFYRYFDGLAHVVVSLLDDLLGQIVDLAVSAGRPGDPEVLRAGLQRAVEAFDEHGPLIRGLVEAAAVDAEVEGAYRVVLERSIDAMAALIAEGIAEGGLRQVSPDDVARALTLMNGYYLLDTLGREPKADPAVVLETLWTVWTGALGMSVSGPVTRSRTELPTRRPAGRRSTSPRSPRKD
jgi:AcrR family transcriptional regulator